MAALIVKVPLVIAKAPNQADIYLYQGAVLPTDLLAGEADRLLAEGFVDSVPDAEEIAAPAGPAAVAPDGLPDDSWKVEEIDAYAEAHGVTFAAGTKKAEKLEQLAQPSA